MSALGQEPSHNRQPLCSWLLFLPSHRWKMSWIKFCSIPTNYLVYMSIVSEWVSTTSILIGSNFWFLTLNFVKAFVTANLFSPSHRTADGSYIKCKKFSGQNCDSLSWKSRLRSSLSQTYICSNLRPTTYPYIIYFPPQQRLQNRSVHLWSLLQVPAQVSLY